MGSSKQQGHVVLLSVSAVSMVLGSIHAFSVFLEPLEMQYGASRATTSLTYSLCLVSLTSAVLFGPTVYSRLKAPTVYICVALLGSVGAILAGTANDLASVWLGYSLIFGFANGLGYGFGLQFAARVNPDHTGLAMGIVTAAYALGAVLAPFGFKIALEFGGFFLSMIALGSTILVVGLSAAIMIARSGAQYSTAQANRLATDVSLSRIATIWVAYGSGVAAGLMAIGHAAGIATAAGSSGWMAAVVIAACNLVGSLICGWFADRVAHRSILFLLPLLSAVALFALSISTGQTLVLMGVVGFAYGGTIATYPAAIAVLFPGASGPIAYGRIFTAWGAAGLLAPWIAGRIYDGTGTYVHALWLAAALATVSAVMVLKFLPTDNSEFNPSG